MSRPLPVNMLLAGTGAVLLVSGLGGKSIGDVLKGSFGKLEVKQPNIGSPSESTGAEAANTAGGGPFAASPVSFSQSTVGIPFPATPAIHTPHDIPVPYKGLSCEAKYLIDRGIWNPTTAQINEARAACKR